MRLLCGSVIAYWLAGIINPAFIAIAVVIVLFIPILITDYSSLDQADMNQQSNHPDKPNKPVKKSANIIPSTRRLMDEEINPPKKH
jgi:hypothetical protein